MRTVVHVTHEAVEKVGGIGAVLEGLLPCDAYRQRQQRTILLGPLFVTGPSADDRLGPSGKVLYSSADRITRHPLSRTLDQVCRDYHVDVVYGRRTFIDPHTGGHLSPEVVLIDVARMDLNRVNTFKAEFWKSYGIDSTRYEQSWEYELYLRLAPPALAVLRALGAADCGDQCVICAHEFMGLPTALAAKQAPDHAFRTIFCAHEVAAIRRIVEDHPGHDMMFYNVLPAALENGRYVDDLFGSQDDYCRHALVKASRHCDKVFAVGDYVVQELRFLGPEFADADILTTYNGIPAEPITLDRKRVSKRRLQDYAEILLGDRPDYIFSHVTRTAPSKGLWRDIRVLECLEKEFRRTGTSAVLFMLSTEGPPRRPEHIREMERWWHWPIAHREVGADLAPGEALVYQGVQAFNARSRQIKVVYVNQFGWQREVCGNRMPADMEFMDIRCGTDVEFGQSVYEPFGIAHLEPLTFGGICVISRVCGCAGFVEKVTDGRCVPNVIVADYCRLGPERCDARAALSITRDQRDRHERQVAAHVARRLLEFLPTDDASTDALLASGYELARKMSWDVVAGQYLLPGIDAACRTSPQIRVA